MGLLYAYLSAGTRKLAANVILHDVERNEHDGSSKRNPMNHAAHQGNPSALVKSDFWFFEHITLCDLPPDAVENVQSSRLAEGLEAMPPRLLLSITRVDAEGVLWWCV